MRRKISNAPRKIPRQDLVDKVNEEINVSHPIFYDTYDLCERYHSNTLQKFNLVLLRAIYSHFEIPVKLRDKKKILLDKLSDVISDCRSTTGRFATGRFWPFT